MNQDHKPGNSTEPTSRHNRAEDRQPTDRDVRGTTRAQVGTLPSDLRTGIADMVIALVLTGALFAFLYWQAHQGDSDTYQTMSDRMDPDPDVYRFYWLSQAFGWTALLWSWIAVLAGLYTAIDHAGQRPGLRRRIIGFHRAASLTTILLMAGHIWLLVIGNMGETWVHVTIPWTGYETGRFPMLLGFGGFYGSILLGLTFYLRSRLGHRTWRIAHRFTILTYALGVWHTLVSGSNVAYSDDWVRTAVWVVQLPVCVLLVLRTLRPLSRAERVGGRVPWRLRHVPQVFLAVGTIAVAAWIAVMLVTGTTGGEPRPSIESPAHQHHE